MTLNKKTYSVLERYLSELSKGNVINSPLDKSTKDELIWRIFGHKAKQLTLICLDEKLKESQAFLEMLILYDADLKFRLPVINRIAELEECVSEINNL